MENSVLRVDKSFFGRETAGGERTFISMGTEYTDTLLSHARWAMSRIFSCFGYSKIELIPKHCPWSRCQGAR